MTEVRNAPFGSVLAPTMAVADFGEGAWSQVDYPATGPVSLHPAAHVLHYGSECFEGFKVYRHADGSLHVFRLDRHIERMRQSARLLFLPEPPVALLTEMVLGLIDRVRHEVPAAPGALYVRPLLIGTMANIGAAAVPSSEAKLIVLASPVWDYFAGGMKPLRILVEEQAQRCAAHLGMVKTGGNYAAAMGPTLAARQQYAVDQVLFCPSGDVQETGAANFLLIREGALLTRHLDTSFLHGVTRDSLLTLARDMRWTVREQHITVQEMLDWVRDGEAALSGTAAVLAGVGTLIRQGVEHRVGDGQVGSETRKLRAALVAIQQGLEADTHGWLTPVS